MTPSKTSESVCKIGRLCRDQRKKFGLKQAEAAGLLGVGVRFLSELERGKETLAFGKVLQVLNGIGLSFHVTTKTNSDPGAK